MSGEEAERVRKLESQVETLKAQLARANETVAQARRREEIVEELLAERELQKQIGAEAAAVRKRQAPLDVVRHTLGRIIKRGRT